jgi:hypothetical protein
MGQCWQGFRQCDPPAGSGSACAAAQLLAKADALLVGLFRCTAFARLDAGRAATVPSDTEGTYSAAPQAPADLAGSAFTPMRCDDVAQGLFTPMRCDDVAQGLPRSAELYSALLQRPRARSVECNSTLRGGPCTARRGDDAVHSLFPHTRGDDAVQGPVRGGRAPPVRLAGFANYCAHAPPPLMPQRGDARPVPTELAQVAETMLNFGSGCRVFGLA